MSGTSNTFSISNTISQIETGVANAVGQVANTLANDLTSIETSVANSINQIANNITNTVTQTEASLIAQYNQFTNNITTFLNNEYNSISNTVSTIYQDFFNSIPNNLSISSLFSNIANTVDNFQRYFSAPFSITAMNPMNIVNKPSSAPLPGPEHSNLGTTQINRLATGDNQQYTVIAQREGTRVTNIPMGLSTSFWHEPTSSYNSQYGSNYVFQTKNGHVQEFDDTPNALRYHLYHPSGTYTEIDNNGQKAQKITGNNFEILVQDNNIYIGGNNNVTVDGSQSVYIKNSCYVQVDGDLNARVKNDLNAVVHGAAVINATEDITLKGNNIHFECNTFNVMAYQNTKIQTVDHALITNTAITSATSYAKVVSKSITNDSTDFYLNASTIHAWNGVIVQTLDSHGDTGNSSPTLFLKVADTTQDKITLPTYIQPLTIVAPTTPRAFPQPPEFEEDPINNKYAIQAINYDDAPQGTAPSAGNVVAPPSYLNIATTTTPVPIPATQQQALTAVDTSALTSATNIPGSTVLSQHMTLASVSTDTAVSHYKVIPQAGLTEGQIVANLKYLSINVIDPIMNKYGKGNVLVTSAFRLNAADSYVSQHQLGQAVDIQFLDIPKSQYAARCAEIISFLPHDQILFEFVWNGSTHTAWVHISLTNGSNRQQYATIDVSNNKFTNGSLYNPFDNTVVAVASTAPTDGITSTASVIT